MCHHLLKINIVMVISVVYGKNVHTLCEQGRWWCLCLAGLQMCMYVYK